ncbi:hypothetical protein B7982_14650 [Fibrobacter sp. UWB2]|uniref:AAA family ATPase n=1 Tax=Fibrobacter sp. UWB2 TaxID=1964358 RepID=UPI000B524248|nr:AAA family ATPase [Fibrobacter sp. UWB2]OWV18979.1 hypothetical protein B7982_14650 [Fibrobacter sp. UWB2]
MDIYMPEKMLILKFRKNDLSTDSGKQIEFSGASAMKFFGIPANKNSDDYEFIYKAKDDYKSDKNDTRIQVQLKRSNQRKDYKIYPPKSFEDGYYEGSLKDFLLKDLGLCERNNSNDYLVFYEVGEKKIGFSYYRSDSMFVFDKESKKTEKNNDSYNLVFYGAPGTGKSFEMKKNTLDGSVVRTTLHPDSDYSTFVGSYKPTMRPEEAVGNSKNVKEVIAYSFVKQAFLKAYLGAWKKYSEMEGGNGALPKQYLVIEEINRGNCAQVFGDIFQLLDRSENGFSTYPIEADDDIRKEIERSFKNDYKLSSVLKINTVVDGYISSIPGSDLSHDVQEGRVLLLPPNLYIWATMNTSDQSLFPMDSAFKRRWEWKYFPIKEDVNKKWYISFGEENNLQKCEWWRFLKEINRRIGDLTRSEDKKIGFYFCKAQKGEIKQEAFVGKVLFYLYNEIMRIYGIEDFFTDENDTKEEPISFQSFYKEDGSINASKVEEFLKKMGLVQAIQSVKSYTIDNDNEEISANELIHKTLEKYIDKNNTESAEDIVKKWNSEMGLNLVTTEEIDEADSLEDGHGDLIYIKRVLENDDLELFIQKVQEKFKIKIKLSTKNIKKNK